MDENHHYDLAICKCENGYEVIERLNIGDIKSVEKSVYLASCNNASLVIHASNSHYSFYINQRARKFCLEQLKLNTCLQRLLEDLQVLLLGYMRMDQAVVIMPSLQTLSVCIFRVLSIF